MRIKPRPSLLICTILSATTVVFGGLFVGTDAKLQETKEQVEQLEVQLWEDKRDGESNLAACQEAVKVSQEAVLDRLDAKFYEYSFGAVADDCLRR